MSKIHDRLEAEERLALHYNAKMLQAQVSAASEDNVSKKDRLLLSIIRTWWDCIRTSELEECFSEEEIEEFYPNESGYTRDINPIDKDIKALFEKIKVML